MLGLSQRVRSHALQAGVAAFALLATALLAGCSDAGPSAPKAFDPNTEWQPDVEITYPAPLSEDEKARLRLEDLHRTYDGKLEGWAPAPEEIPLERWEAEDDPSLYVACGRDSGWEMADRGGPTQQFAPDDPRYTAQVAALYICNARFSVDPNDRRQKNNDQLGLEYDYYVQWWIPCLATLGYSTDVETPSRDTYIASKGYPAFPDGTLWLSEIYMSVARSVSDNDKMAQIEAKCPQSPPDAAIWGEGNS